MGEYNYSRGRGRLGARFQSRDIVEDEWSSNTRPFEHVCRPVIVDSEGRTRPGIFILPPPSHEVEGYQTKIETVVEHVYPPLPYKVSPPTTRETLKEYAVYDTNTGLRKNYSGDQPSNINEFLAGFQASEAIAEATGGRRTGFPGGLFQRRIPNQVYDRGGAPTQDSATRQPNGAIAVYRPNQEDNYNRRNAYEQKIESSPAQRGWMRSSRPGGASPPKYETTISKATARATPTVTNAPLRGRFSVEPPAEFQKMQTIQEVIDSKEAAKRYGSLANSTPKIDSSLPTIDSKQAKSKYNGSMV